MSGQLAIEAAREYAKVAASLSAYGAEDIRACYREGFMAGAAWQSEQSAKLLDGVVRARDLDKETSDG